MILYGPNAEPIVCTQYRLGIGFHEQWVPVPEGEPEAAIESDQSDVDAFSTTYLDICEYGDERWSWLTILDSNSTEAFCYERNRPTNETTIKSIHDAIFGIWTG